MATVLLSPVINGTSVLGPTGLPLSGGLIYTYQAGSSTPLSTYTDVGGVIANPNPIQLGSDGKPTNEIWLTSGYSYKFQIQSSSGVLIQTLDNLYGIPSSSGGGGGTSLPTGCILLWSGSAGSIPSGFILCDGTNGTPDLRNNFIIGAGNSYSVGQTGGSKDAIVVSHSHSTTDPGHYHVYSGVVSGGTGIQSGSGYSITNVNTAGNYTGVVIQSAGTSGTNANLPPFYALCYIQKT